MCVHYSIFVKKAFLRFVRNTNSARAIAAKVCRFRCWTLSSFLCFKNKVINKYVSSSYLPVCLYASFINSQWIYSSCNPWSCDVRDLPWSVSEWWIAWCVKLCELRVFSSQFGRNSGKNRIVVLLQNVLHCLGDNISAPLIILETRWRSDRSKSKSVRPSSPGNMIPHRGRGRKVCTAPRRSTSGLALNAGGGDIWLCYVGRTSIWFWCTVYAWWRRTGWNWLKLTNRVEL